MEELLELSAKGDFTALLSCAQDKLDGCLPEMRHVLHGAIGRAHFELKAYAEAVVALDKGIALNPRYVAGMVTRGQSRIAQGEYEFAIMDLVEAMRIDPHLNANELVGYAHAMLGQQQQAVDAYSAGLKKGVNIRVLRRRARAFVALRQFGDARNDWMSILSNQLTDAQGREEIMSANRVPEQAAPVTAVSTQGPITQILAEQGFLSVDIASVSRRNPLLQGGGVYVLLFSQGDFYVGQTITAVTRLQTHRRANPDLDGIWFKSARADELIAAETGLISLFELKSLRLRNLKQVCFLNIFDAFRQRRWRADKNYNHVCGKRFENQQMRQKHQARFEQLTAKPYYAFLVSFLRAYVKKTIPNYVASEYTYWSLSCLPRHLLSSHCITRININEVPVLSIFEQQDGTLQISLYASQLPFLTTLEEKKGFEDLFVGLSTVHFECNESFDKAAPDEIAIYGGEADFMGILENEVLLSSIRCFNLRMMNNVGNETAFRRPPSHCLSLSDSLF